MDSQDATLIEPALAERIARKKKELEGLKPFDKASLKRLEESFNVEMTYNSNAIEGNSLSLKETKLVVEDGLTIGGKTMREHLEATNHMKAIEFVKSLVGKKKIEEDDVLGLHALILDRIDPHNAGFYRKCGVRISGTDYSPPSFHQVPMLMREVYFQLNRTIGAPIEVSAALHMLFVNIHPFVDGNGRTARLLLNLYLMRSGYPPVIFLRAERKKYIRTIIDAQSGENPAPFSNFVAKAVERSLDIYLDSLGKEQQEYLSLEAAAKHSKYGAEYLGLLARKGTIGAVKFGRNWKITLEALKDYEDSQGTKQ